jgi:PadR family transcriptional regulator PadR
MISLDNREGTMTPQDRSRDVVQGTLDMLVLKALSLTPMHGWGITNRIHQITKGVLTVNPGSLYPALERLQDRGWITAAWETTESGRNAKYYRLSAAGRRRLGTETESWRRMAAAIEAVLRTT